MSESHFLYGPPKAKIAYVLKHKNCYGCGCGHAWSPLWLANLPIMDAKYQQKVSLQAEIYKSL